MTMLQTVVFILLPGLGSLCGNGGNQRIIANLQSQLKLVSDSLGTLTSQCENVIAFHATLGSAEIKDLPEKSPLVFKTVRINIGRGYNSTSGIFIAPVGGVYVCDWTIMTKPGVYFHSELVVNGKQMAVNNLHASSSKHRQATTMTIVKLEREDQVWIKPYKGYKGIYAYSGDWSKFSCFKL